MEERSQVAVGLAVLNHDASSVASGSWSFTYYVRRVQSRTSTVFQDGAASCGYPKADWAGLVPSGDESRLDDQS
jgi:hypothetical protein